MEERLKTFFHLVKILFGIILLQCINLQILHFNYYRGLSEKNCIRTIDLGIPRGKIYDRNGRVLAEDKICFNLVYVPYDIKNPQEVASTLSDIFGFNKKDLLQQFNKSSSDPFERIVLKYNLTQSEIAAVSEYAFKLPGVFVQTGLNRQYTLKEGTCHVLGYVGEINQDELDIMRDQGLKPGHCIGRYGIEKQYDEFLRGKSGGYQIEVDAHGHQRKILKEIAMIPGNNIVLTLDQSIQEACRDALGDKQGSIIVMNPRNGEVLGLVNNPTFDPSNVAKYLKPPYSNKTPFLNRVIAGQYAPGSIFKIITEIAALETGEIGEHDRIECTGAMNVGDRIFHCWKEEGHGWVDINMALPFSCNIFFGTVGSKLGTEKILEYAGLFDFGKPTGIDLPGEKSGNLPSSYQSGGAINLAIGQGALAVTPIQLCVMISSIANGGNLWRPYLVKKIQSPDGKIIKEFQPVVKKTIFISDETLTILRRGLRNVVKFGTGAGANIPGIEISGKTGTAQIAQRELGLPTRGAFACYAPSDSPNIAMVVFLDEGSSGQAARIAGSIIKKVFTSEETTSETTISETEELQPLLSGSEGFE
ncbi:MAG: Stage V sporulation protein D [candidate division TA06 bacterium ADurb.Bin131]|uniref:Stage V sporulation protein D n=1 Tax=candidate division TA06 bacterium ADurb.Bin131 TaxID=1852827 RepID=A0A1V6C4R3_UNCT6|nr:MAG: Stage V sporulation protein D [candidate division TA06 bacterium ADurb.Bin131]